MANGGWYGTEAEWERIEAPIKLLDATFEQFAALHSLTVTRNHKEWPGRSVVWGREIGCLVQLYLDSEETLGVNLWACASRDVGDKRYWKNEFLFKGALAEAVAPCLSKDLEEAKAKLDLWCSHPDQLEFATTISRV